MSDAWSVRLFVRRNLISRLFDAFTFDLSMRYNAYEVNATVLQIVDDNGIVTQMGVPEARQGRAGSKRTIVFAVFRHEGIFHLHDGEFLGLFLQIRKSQSKFLNAGFV